MKKLSIITLALLFIVQLAVPYSMIRSKEKILRDGTVFRFKTRPIDPADPFQGRYVRLGYENDYIPCKKDPDLDLQRGESFFAILDVDEAGFARFTGWSREQPTEGHCLKTEYRGARTQWNRNTRKSTYKGIRVNMPFNRFYMDEAKAPRAETLARDASRNTNCWAEVRILNGKAVIEDVYAEGQSLRDLAAEKE